MKKDKIQDIVILTLIVGIFYLFYKTAGYNIIVPNRHEIGTDDDVIELTDARPVFNLLTESVTYELLDTLAKLKGAQNASELLMEEFNGRSIEDVTVMLQNIRVDQLINTLASLDVELIETDPFTDELNMDDDELNIESN